MPATQPNILFFFPDQQRADWIEAAPGLDIRTPNIDRLKKMGTTFTRTYTPSPLCAPARACLASGRAYGDCGVWNNCQSYPLDLPTYYQALRDVGYRVAGVGKFDLHKDTFGDLDWYLDGSRLIKEWGFTEGIDNEGKFDGITSYENVGTAKGPYLHHLQQRGLADGYVKQIRHSPAAHLSTLPQESYCDTWIANNGLGFIQNFPANQPWHLVVNFAGPHNPFDVTPEMAESVADRNVPMPYPTAAEKINTEEHHMIRRHYIAMIEHIDMQIGRYLDAIEARGELENTLIVYSSDHGEMLGDHDHFGKCVWHEASSHIPLIIAGPGLQAGATSDALVSLHDLAATFVDAAGAAPMPDMEARSLLPILKGNATTHRDVITSGLYHPTGEGWDMVVEGTLKMITTKEKQSLFDIKNDPHETHDIAQAHPEIVARLRAQRMQSFPVMV